MCIPKLVLEIFAFIRLNALRNRMNAVFSILPRVEIKVERIFVVLYRDGSSFKDAKKIPMI